MPIRDNKLARNAQQRAAERAKSRIKDRTSAPDKLTIEEQLTRLEEDIRKLKIEFDIYFNGASKRPPYDTKNRVEAHIKRLGDDRTLTYAQRFQCNSLAARYAAFRDLWRRIMQGREEGRDPATAARAAHHKEEPKARAASVFTCGDAHTDVQTVKQIYQTLVEAKQRCGEPTEELSFPRFHRLIAAQTDNLKKRLGCESVRFSVAVKDGQVSFKAKADR
ncbi:MAG: MXAN_5187 C-terminal domain-containing protein [Pyrinomonadaceae bacterium]